MREGQKKLYAIIFFYNFVIPITHILMTIIQLQYLIEVANCGSFSAAAERCFVTQPSLSMQIKALEDELGVILLDRSKKPVIPTDAGSVVIAQAQETLRAYNYIRESVAELKGETSGKLRLGVIPTIAPYLLHKFIPDFVREYPRVELEIREMITADIIEALKHDNIDAAIVASGTCGDSITEHDLFSDRFYAYVSPENPLFERSNIRIEDIDLQEKLCDLIIKEDLSVRQLEERIKRLEGAGKPQARQEQSLPDDYYRMLGIVGKYFENSISLKRTSAGKGTMTIHFSSDEEVQKFLKALEDSGI